MSPNNLRSIRLTHRPPLRLYQLAALANLSPTTIAGAEKWGLRLRPASRKRIADALGEPESAIWPGQEQSASAS